MIVKIKEYKVGKRGLRGSVVSLPKVFVDDNRIRPGDALAFYRGIIDGKDALIITKEPKKHKTN